MVDPELVRRARNQMKRAADYQFFFDHLTSPDWIPALVEEGFLQDPPPAEIEGGYIRYPPWPESAYLARVAGDAPELVLRVIEAIPEIDNVLVKKDLVHAAADMPPSISISLVERILGWIDPNSSRLIVEPTLDLARRLLDVGAVEEAVAIAMKLGDVPLDTESAAGWLDRTNRQVRGWVEDSVSQFFGELTGDAAEYALEQVAKGLSLILEYESGAPESVPARDGSYVWRPAIEPHEQNRDYDERTFLVEVVRDLAEQIAADQAQNREHFIAKLEGWRWAVFIRVALHLARLHAAAMSEKTRELILTPELFESINLRHEYYWLVHDAMTAPKPLFPVAEYITLVEAGPPESFLERFSGTADEEPALRAWEVERLHPVKEVLPEDWAARYAEWSEELGEPSHPDFPFFMSGGFAVTRQSPLTTQELSEMATEEIVEFLAGWESSEGFTEPSADDLGRALAGAVTSNPVKFAESAHDFRLEEPTYVRHLLDGLRRAVEKDQAFNWQPPLELGRWVLEQSDEAFERSDWHEDPNWSWARRSLADLIRDGLDSQEAGIPAELSDPVWELLRRLAEDPDPTPQHEAQYGGSNMDPFTLSLNTIRGSAFHAIVGFVGWLNRGVETKEGPGLPDDLKGLLELHLDVDYDPSLAVRSVYGWGLGILLDADENWVRERIEAIFPKDEGLDAYRKAAWLGYLWHWRPSRRFFDILREPYEVAIARLPNELDAKALSVDMDESLGSHLLSYYWWGVLDLEADGLLATFYGRADDDLRGHMTRTMADGLRNADPLPDEVAQRTIDLWTQRVDASEREPDKDHDSELGSFVWWFRTGLDPAWLMEQLLSIAPRVSEIDNAFVVVERLVEFVDDYPNLALRVLRVLLEKDPWGHVALGHRDDVRSILETAAHSGDEPEERARDLVNWLAARGLDEYGDLL